MGRVGRICTRAAGGRIARERLRRREKREATPRESWRERGRRKSTGVKERARATVTPTPATKLGSTFWRTCTHHTFPILRFSPLPTLLSPFFLSRAAYYSLRQYAYRNLPFGSDQRYSERLITRRRGGIKFRGFNERYRCPPLGRLWFLYQADALFQDTACCLDNERFVWDWPRDCRGSVVVFMYLYVLRVCRFLTGS